MASNAPSLLSKKKFANTAAEPYMGSKGMPIGDERAITIGVFFDTTNAPTLPFWIAFKGSVPVGLALDKICRTGDITNNNNTLEDENDRWHVFPLASKMGLPMEEPLDVRCYFDEVAATGDIWYIGKGPKLPAGMPEHAEGRLAKIGSRTVKTEDMSRPTAKAAWTAPPQPAPTGPKAPKAKQQTTFASASAATLAAVASAPVNNDPITINANFVGLGDKVVPITISPDAVVADLLVALRKAEPEATKMGVRFMFFNKYVRKETESLRAVPLIDGSAIDVCTGRFLSENEMTLYLADRHLADVQAALKAYKGPIDVNTRRHWNEQLMKALMLFDSLQEVPEDIRMRRKDGVKRAIAQQDALADIDLV